MLVWKLDRFGRSTLDVLSNIQALAHCGVRFEAVTQGLVVDPRRFDPTAHLILAVLAAVAEFEREIIRERTRLGLDRARRAGKRLGRPPRHSSDLVKIPELRAAGRSWRELAAVLRCPVDAARRAWRKGTPEPTP